MKCGSGLGLFCVAWPLPSHVDTYLSILCITLALIAQQLSAYFNVVEFSNAQKKKNVFFAPN